MRWDDAEPDGTPFQAFAAAATIIVIAAVVCGILYWTAQLWFWLEGLA